VKDDFLGKKMEGFNASLRFKDIGIIQFQGGLKFIGLGVITSRRRFMIELIRKLKEPFNLLL